MMESYFYGKMIGLTDWASVSGIRMIVIILGTLAMIFALRVLKKRTFEAYLRKEGGKPEKRKRATTLSQIISTVGRIFILTIASMLVLSEIGIDLKPIIAAAGVGGIAIGFGAQSLVKDVISGFFILMEDQVRVDDVVEIGNSAGLVEHVGLRVLTLRDFSGVVHIIPNGSIDKVKNLTKGYSRYVFDIGVAYKEDVDEVMEIMRNVGEGLRQDPEFAEQILEPMEVLGLDKFGDSALIIKARITTKPIMQWTVAREYNRRLKKAFDAAGVEIPFPHRTLYMGENKKGETQPLIVTLRDGKKSAG